MPHFSVHFTHGSKMDLTIVIPVYNSANRLIRLGKKLIKVLSSMPVCFEVIMVDDASQDNSFEYIKKMNCLDNHIKGIKLKKNMGQHVAIFTGLSYASGRYVLIMDDDMENNIKVLPEFWQKTAQGWDVISGQRISQDNKTRKLYDIRCIINLTISLIARQRFNDGTSPFKLFKRDLIHKLIQKETGNLLIPEYVIMKGQNVAELPLPADQTEFKSRYTIKKLLEHALMLLCSFCFVLFGSQAIGLFYKFNKMQVRSNIRTVTGLTYLEKNTI